MNHPHLGTRLYNTPLIVEPARAAEIERVFRLYQAHGAPRPNAMEDEEASTKPPRIESASLTDLVRRPDKPYDMTASGIAVIPVVGTLVQRTGGMQPFSGMIPYAYIGRKLQAAMQDPDVAAVLLEVDSPGGEVNGCFELAEQIVAARSIKPVWAHANEVAWSAAYAIACSAERLYLPETGGVGSIGVIALHIDQSKYDAKAGYVYTYIYAGARKKDFNPHEPLSGAARAIEQSEIDRVYDIFVVHVANARGIDPENVIATEAAMLNPEQAVSGKFADGIQTFAETVSLLEDKIKTRLDTTFIFANRAAAANGHSLTSLQEKPMSDKAPKPAVTAEQPGADQPKHTDAQLQAAVEKARIEARAEGHAAGVTEGTATGVKAERERIRGILSHAEAKDRGGLALSLALDSDLAVEQVVKALTAAPKQMNTGFAAAMAQMKNPAVGAEGGAALEQGGVKISHASIYETRRQSSKETTKH